MTAGYSGTPLALKLNLKHGLRVWSDGMPDSVRDEIATARFAVGAARRTAKRRSMPRISSSPRAARSRPSSTSCCRGSLRRG